MLTVIIAAICFAIDRVAKVLTQVFVKPVGSIVVIENIFSFTYVENEGAAHGILQGKRWLFIAITCAVVVFMVIFLLKNYSRMPPLFRVSVGLILGGALGNLFDRIVYGYVVDMMQVTFIDYPVFNPADNMLVVGVILLGIYLLFLDKVFFVDKKKTSPKEKEDGDNNAE